MDIRSLKYFLMVAECLNFTEASRRLFIAQSALSQQIAELEKKVGVALFERNKRSVRLTNAGAIFLNDAQDIVRRYEEALIRVRQTEQGLLGQLNVGYLSESFANFLPPFIQGFINNYPTIDLHFEGLNNGPLMDKLADSEIDIAFTVNLGLEYVPDVEQILIGQDYVSVILPRNHPFSSDKSNNFSRFSNEHFIFMDRNQSPQGFDRTIQICADAGFSPNISSNVHNIKDIIFMVESGLGIAILPKNVVENYSRNLCIIPIENGKYVINLVAAWKKNNKNPSLPFFLEALQLEVSSL